MASVDEYNRLGPEAAARLRSHLSPDVLTATFLFFATADSNYVTGQVLAADCGATACLVPVPRAAGKVLRRFGVSRRGIVRAQTGRFPKIGLLQQRPPLIFDVVEACTA